MADEEDFIDEDDIVMVDSEDDIEDLEDDDDGENHMNDVNDGEVDRSTSTSTSTAPPQEEDSAVARRRAIQGIMRDNTLSDREKSMRIQNLMSGGRTQVSTAPSPIMPQQEDTKCSHYERNCNIIAPCCNRIVGCRICHDETSPPGHPPMNRFMVREVVCKHCGVRQNAS